MDKKLLAIDGNSLMHRAFWALPQMTDEKGRNTNAVYGFFVMLFKMVDELAPTHITVAFDKSAKTFRHEFYADYKAGRKKTPTELSEQFKTIRDALLTAGINYIELEDFEGDDILGTLSKMPDIKKYIVTGDRDALSLVSGDTRVVITKKGVTETQIFDIETLKSEYGLAPKQIPDLKALMGDSSDNIPGVAGVGEKTALKLLSQFGSIERLYESMDELPQNKLKEKLIADRENAFLSKKLATIRTDVPLPEGALDKSAFNGFDTQALKKLCEEYKFRAFLKRFNISEPKKQAEEKYISLSEIAGIIADKHFALYLGEDIHIAADEETDYVIRVKKTLIDDGVGFDEAVSALKPYTNGCIAGFDVKAMLHAFGGGFENAFDVMIADWVADPSRAKYEIGGICERAGLTVSAAALLTLKKAQEEKIRADKTEYIYYEIELPLMRVLYEMEKEGLLVSREQLLKLQGEYSGKIDALTAEIFEYAGQQFNINSTKQLGKVLFEDMGLPVIKKTKTGYSTDIEVLERLSEEHPIINSIIEYRQITKLKSTYVDGLLAVIKNGRVHTTFLQTATQTGRLSSVEPNLQNIPVRSDMAEDIRNAFTAPEGYTIVSADYSQIELRILAHIADDEHLKDAFLKGQDIHARTASEILGIDIESVTKKQRSEAKAVNFGIVYGISDFGLARNIGISRFKAKTYIKKYLEEFSGVRKYMDDIVKEAHQNGFVRTMWGRKRYIRELLSANYNIRSFGERAALNTPIQGSAADIIKIAMIKARKALDGLDAKLVLQVHDELIVYARDDIAEKVGDVLKESMESAAKLSVPLTVSVAQGKCWAEAK